jgi:hypothetical protein
MKYNITGVSNPSNIECHAFFIGFYLAIMITLSLGGEKVILTVRSSGREINGTETRL